MYFESFSAVIDMGGHGLYVWVAYGLSAVTFALNLIIPIFKRKRFIAEQLRQRRREEIHASDS